MKAFSERTTAGSDWLGRYYTNTDISQLLVNQIVGLSPKRILDLGAGAGSLTLAANIKWRSAELLTVDIDEQARVLLEKSLNASGKNIKHKHVHADALSENLLTLINNKKSIDVAVCNPPFIIPKWRNGFAEILEDAGFSGCTPAVSSVDAALLFLAQNLRLLSDGATLGIILPDSLISSVKYRHFRHELLSRYHVEKVLRLPRRSFEKTDALAHILIISKRKPSLNLVPLLRLESAESLSEPLVVSIEEATERLDFEYHSNRIQKNSMYTENSTLSQIRADIKRGSLNSLESRNVQFPTFHTTDMKSTYFGRWCDLRRFGSKKSHTTLNQQNLVMASPGDILIARVGRNLEQKILGVASGFPVITDCILRLTVPKALREEALMQLSSPSGQAWIASRAYGVGAQHITKADLLEFPLYR